MSFDGFFALIDNKGSFLNVSVFLS